MIKRGTVLYFPHGGGPLPLLEDPGHASMNAFLRAYPTRIERPDAIVVFSAHWEEKEIAITAAAAPPLIFDYHGFPPQTYEYRYPAPGHPELAGRVRDMLHTAGIAARLDAGRGFDHGLFVPLMLMYPDADIPCIQVSLSSSLDAGLHIRIGNALSALSGENLLLLGSGFSFHNMQALMSKSDDIEDPRNRAFEDWLAQTCTDPNLGEAERAARLADWHAAPEARYCHPREEHLLPLQLCYGIARAPATMPFQDKVAGFVTSAYEWR